MPTETNVFPSTSFPVPHRFVLEQLRHLVTGLALVSIAPPVVWHVVNVCQHALQQLFWAPHHMLIWDEGPGVGQVQNMDIFQQNCCTCGMNWTILDFYD